MDCIVWQGDCKFRSPVRCKSPPYKPQRLFTHICSLHVVYNCFVMAIAAQDLRAGIIFKENGKLYTVVSYHHHKMGRGKATIRVKVRDVETGNVRELTFNNNSSVEEVDVERKNIEFVFSNPRKNEVVFSDPATKQRIVLQTDAIDGSQLQYLKEGTSVQAMLNENGEMISIQLPMTVDLEITETGPSDKGDTQGSARKPATLETGLVVQVPMFLKIGDRVRVNTQTGDYKERLS